MDSLVNFIDDVVDFVDAEIAGRGGAGMFPALGAWDIDRLRGPRRHIEGVLRHGRQCLGSCQAQRYAGEGGRMGGYCDIWK